MKGMSVLKIPCHEWNCERHTWHLFNAETTRVLHIKSALRRGVFGRISRESEDIQALAAVWKAIDAEAHPDDSLSKHMTTHVFRVKRARPARPANPPPDKVTRMSGAQRQAKNARAFRARLRARH